MTEAIFGLAGVVIVAILNVLSVVLSNRKQSRETAAEFDKRMEIYKTEINASLDKQQTVFNIKFDALTSEVREHNNFAKRMPVVEEQIKVANHRIGDLERRVGA